MKIKLKGAYANPAGSSGGEASANANANNVAATASTSTTAYYPHQQVPPSSFPTSAAPLPAAAHPNFQPVEGSSSASASSSHADEDYLNAPLDLPESSGDEYEEEEQRRPGRPAGAVGSRRRKHFKSVSPRPRRGTRMRGSEEHNGDDDIIDDDDEEDDPDAKFVVSSPRRPSTGKKRGRPRLPRDADGNIVHTSMPRKKGRSRSELEDEDGEIDYGREDSMPEGDDTGMMLDDEDEEDSAGLPSGTVTPGGAQIPSRRAAGSAGPGEVKRRGGFGVGGVPRSKQVKGIVYDVADDELALPLDPNGETKVDNSGRLLGGREYKAATFTCPTRSDPERLYMLAIDAARCAGFRDSLYFFRRNPLIHKLNCSQEEKEMLIQKGRLHVNLKSRQVTIITARNCFRIFGARFVKNGKNVTDDYYEAAALARGKIAGSPAYNEVYDPDIDNTTLAMPKVGNFSKKLSNGRPAYMKIAKAFEFAQAPLGSAPPENTEERDRQLERERLRKQKEEEEEEAADAAAGITKSAFRALKIPAVSGYRAIEFGLVNGVSAAQFGGNGAPPFGEQWEKSKARKPAPFLNGYNWMLEFAKAASKNNSAILGVRREYNAYHAMTLGNTATPQGRLEEQEGVWDISGDEDEYETVAEYKKREGLGEKLDEDEIDDRQRGNTPEPSASALGRPDKAEKPVKAEVDDESMAIDDKERDNKRTVNNTTHPDDPPKKKLRRRRSPIRGFYESHTKQPQVRTDTQPTQMLEYEKLDLVPHVGFSASEADASEHTKELEMLRKAAALGGVATVDYILDSQPAQLVV